MNTAPRPAANLAHWAERIDMAAAFDRVQATPQRIVLTLHPTADGIAHRLDLHEGP